MSDLIEKVEKLISEKLETYLAEGIEEDLFLKFCATNAIRTVLEEMLKDGKCVLSAGASVQTKLFHKEFHGVPEYYEIGPEASEKAARVAINQFATSNNITIGGENE